MITLLRSWWTFSSSGLYLVFWVGMRWEQMEKRTRTSWEEEMQVATSPGECHLHEVHEVHFLCCPVRGGHWEGPGGNTCLNQEGGDTYLTTWAAAVLKNPSAKKSAVSGLCRDQLGRPGEGGKGWDRVTVEVGPMAQTDPPR